MIFKGRSELAAPFKVYPQVLENVRVTDKKAAQDDAAVQKMVQAVAEALGDTGAYSCKGVWNRAGGSRDGGDSGGGDLQEVCG